MRKVSVSFSKGDRHEKSITLSVFRVKSRYLSGKEVYLGNESYVNDALRRGGAVVLRLFSDEWHYVLLTRKDMVLMTYRLSKIVRRAIIALCRGNILIKLR